MILGEVEETVTTVELDEETFEEIYKVCLYKPAERCDFVYSTNHCIISVLSI